MLKLRENRSILQKSVIFLFIFVFIVAFLLFLTHIYIRPLNYFDRMPFLLYIGFAIIIAVFFSFVIFELDNENKRLLKFRFLSENSIKIILMIIMSITIFIPPISFTTTVIDWNQVGIFNYFRAISFLIGCLFLPGANLFKIFFPKNTLHKRFKVESFIVKITLYPLLSLMYLGIFVLILDQIGILVRELFILILFLSILGLFFIDLIIQKMRDNNIEVNIVEIKISKYTLIILVIALAVILISLGIQINAKYLVGSDSWVGISSAKYIGSLDANPVDRRYTYAIFWGYHSFGLSLLSGLPYININALLTPFCYLSVTSIYLFMKAILYNFKEKYIILSTILVLTFSSLLYFEYLGFENTSPLISDFVFFFRFKSFAYFLLFTSLALFLITSKTNIALNLKAKNMLNTEEFKVIILSAFFLIYSYMIYLLPLLAGFYLIFLYCLFSNKKKQNFQIFFYFIIFLFLFFIAFDILANFFLSDIFLLEFNIFLSFGSHLRAIPKIIRALLIYSILGGVLISYFIFLKLSNKYIHGKKKANKEKNFFQRKFSESKIWSTIKKNPKFIFIFSLIIFSTLLIIEIHNIVLEEFFLDYKLIELDFLAFYLDRIFIGIGFIGILAVYLSYFCFKKKNQLFYVLISWILISLGIASIIIFKEFFIDYPFIIPQDLPRYDYLMMNYWFDRVWYYSIPAFSILSSIGLIKLKKKLKNNRFLVKRKNIREIFIFSSVSILIFLSCSTFVLGGMYWACSYKSGTGGYSDSEAQMVGWISEHIPRRSNISIDNFFLSQSRDKKRMLEFITDCNAFYINDIVEVALKEKDCWNSNLNEENCINSSQIVINYLIRDNIRFLILSEETLSNNLAEKINIQDDLISNFFCEKLYGYKDFAVFYAPI